MISKALAASVIIASATPAMADSWTMNLSSCTPSPTTLRQAKYAIDIGRVLFRGTATGKLVFMCPVHTTGLPTTAAQLRLHAVDDDGSQTKFKAKAELIRMQAGESTLSYVTKVAVDTSSRNVTGPRVYPSAAFDESWDESSYQYFVAVTLTRSTSSAEGSVSAVSVIATPP